MPCQVHQVGRILTIVDGEAGVNRDLLGILPQQARPDGVECARPSQRAHHDGRIRPEYLRTDTLDASAHLSRRPPGEGHQENPARIDAVDDQMGDPVRQGIGLAGSCPGYDQERSRRRPCLSDAVFGGPPLIVVELLQINSGHRVRSVRGATGKRLSTIPVLFATP